VGAPAGLSARDAADLARGWVARAVARVHQELCYLRRLARARLADQHHDLRASSGLSGPLHPSFRALAGRLQLTVRRHEFKKDSLCMEWGVCARDVTACYVIVASVCRHPDAFLLLGVLGGCRWGVPPEFRAGERLASREVAAQGMHSRECIARLTQAHFADLMCKHLKFINLVSVKNTTESFHFF